MSYTLTDEQEKLVDEAVDFYYNSSEQVFQYTGGAGTGKSVVANAIVERLGLSMLDVAPMSFIGAASIVMRLKGLTNAKTIHSWIYEPKIVLDYEHMDTYLGKPKKKLIFVPKDMGDKKLILIDEAGCVPYNLKKDIERHGIKIIACGDLNQLPPVADRPAYLYEGKVHRLTQTMRQTEGNAIIYFSQLLLQGKRLQPGYYGNVLIIEEDQLVPSMLSNANVVICGRNATRDKFNKYIRESIIGFSGKLPARGERMMCRKNNWQIEVDGLNLANGLIGTVTNEPSPYGFDGKTYQIDFAPDMCNTTFHHLDCDYKYLHADVKEKDYLKKYARDNGEKFEMAYAITTHISQGGQYGHGIYYEEYMNESINRNLNYTGITRFSDWCIYIIPSRKFY